MVVMRKIWIVTTMRTAKSRRHQGRRHFVHSSFPTVKRYALHAVVFFVSLQSSFGVLQRLLRDEARAAHWQQTMTEMLGHQSNGHV